MVRIVHAAAAPRPPLSAPVEKAVLNIASYCGAVSLPSGIRQEGIVTSVSRGIETTSTRSRSAEMWTIIVVSDRCPPSGVLPKDALMSPARVSEPSTTRLRSSPAELSMGSCSSSPSAVGRSPRRSSMSWRSMLPWMSLYAMAKLLLANRARLSAARPAPRARREARWRWEEAWRGVGADTTGDHRAASAEVGDHRVGRVRRACGRRSVRAAGTPVDVLEPGPGEGELSGEDRDPPLEVTHPAVTGGDVGEERDDQAVEQKVRAAPDADLAGEPAQPVGEDHRGRRDDDEPDEQDPPDRLVPRVRRRPGEQHRHDAHADEEQHLDDDLVGHGAPWVSGR